MNKVNIIKTALMVMTLVLTATRCRDRAHEPVQATTAVKDAAQLVTPDSLNIEMRAQIERGVILGQVRNVYRLLRSEYMYRGGSCENELFDKAFCSKSWNKLLMAVHRKEEQTGTLFFEINHWSMLRYSGVQLSFDEFEVEHVDLFSPVKRASVTFTVYEADTYTPARIDLIYEDGRWVIDNFHNLKYGIDVRNAMWNYLANPNNI